MVADRELARLPNRQFYKNFYPFLAFPRVLILIVFWFLPIVNLVASVITLILWVIFEKALYVYRKNARLVTNVFEELDRLNGGGN